MYWLDSTIITFIGSISRLISFCIKEEDRRLSLEQQSHKDESLTACFFFFPGFGWIDVPGFFHLIFYITHKTVDLLFRSLVGSKYVYGVYVRCSFLF